MALIFRRAAVGVVTVVALVGCGGNQNQSLASGSDSSATSASGTTAAPNRTRTGPHDLCDALQQLRAAGDDKTRLAQGGVRLRALTQSAPPEIRNDVAIEGAYLGALTSDNQDGGTIDYSGTIDPLDYPRSSAEASGLERLYAWERSNC